tara:strand:+ start:187 stop:705 length:519 start_codon:yes stop_codon:yes gene_type:complete
MTKLIDLENELKEITNMAINVMFRMEDYISMALTARKAKENESSFLVLANNLSVSMNGVLQRKAEQFNEKAHESNAQAEANHNKSGSAMWHSENELKYSVVAEAISDISCELMKSCKQNELLISWEHLNQSKVKQVSKGDMNAYREKLGLEPLKGMDNKKQITPLTKLGDNA